jgi:gluconokinase
MVRKIVVMGVSGSGKSLIGARIAQKLQYPFYDGDNYHSPESVNKMQAGIPLTNEDRLSWLQRLNTLLGSESNLVLACSALTPTYRGMLQKGHEGITFVYLKGEYDLIWSRLKERQGHYFSGEAMLQSQFATLIEPTENEAITISIDQPVEGVLVSTLARLEALTIVGNGRERR